jgi:hypothetical protein
MLQASRGFRAESAAAQRTQFFRLPMADRPLLQRLDGRLVATQHRSISVML